LKRLSSLWPLGKTWSAMPAFGRSRTRLVALLVVAIAAPLAMFWSSGVALSAGDTVLEIESLTIPSGSGAHVFTDATASGGKAVSWWSNDSLSGSVTTTAPTTTLTLRAKADLCNGGANATVAIDGANKLSITASTASWADYSGAVSIPAGTHTVTISYTNDVKTSTCDRNLRTDKLTFVGGSGGGGGDITPPMAPISLGATAGDKTAALSWAANTESDLAGYNVFRGTTSGGPYTKINSSLVTSPSYNDTGLTNGTKYFWVVQAVDTSNNSSGNSNEASGTPTAGPDVTPPAAPKNLAAAAGDASVGLNWTANTESDLAGYNVFRGTTSGGPYTKINSSLVTAPSYNDTGVTNGTTYFYVVQAVDSSNNPSGNSNQATATPAASGGGGGASSLIEAENFPPASDFGGRVYTDTSASGGKAVSFWSNDFITTTQTTVAGSTLIVRAFGDQCSGAPTMVLAMDGATVFTASVTAGSWTNYSAAKNVSAGSHTFTISYTNDFKSTTCDRNLRVDSLTVSSGGGSTPTQLLPDLVQDPPTQVSVTQSSATYRLGMNSAVENHGQGPLIVNGHRASTATPNMTADQIVNRSDGSTQTFAGIGTMIFYTPHNHWHYLGFDKYELHNTSDNSLVAPDQKQGFCLGDRFTPNSNGTRNENPTPGPWTTNNCAPGNTAALNLTEGISVGYGDEYVPQLEGQYIDITGVQPGQYYLVHRTNSDQALKETNYTNDVASVLVNLWPNGYGNLSGGGVTVLKTCPGSATCPLSAAANPNAFKYSHAGLPVDGLPFQLRHSPPPDDAPLMVPPAARYFAHQALQRIVGKGSAKAKLRCTRSSRRGFRCATSWKVAGSTYKGTVEVSLPKRNNQYWWVYRADLVRRGKAGFMHLRKGSTRVLVPRPPK
jgi:fibronectin type 3 domain-containing protein